VDGVVPTYVFAQTEEGGVLIEHRGCVTAAGLGVIVLEAAQLLHGARELASTPRRAVGDGLDPREQIVDLVAAAEAARARRELASRRRPFGFERRAWGGQHVDDVVRGLGAAVTVAD